MREASSSGLPVGRVLAVTAATQAFSTLGILALAAMAPRVAADLGVSHALIGYQVGLVFGGAMVASLVAGALVRRFGAVRTSQISLCTIAAGALCSAWGSLPGLAAGALVMGIGYGFPNPAASHLLSRVPSKRGMNLIFSIKQTGVPIGGLLSGLVVPPIAVAAGWQMTFVVCAVLLALVAAVIGAARAAWDSDRAPGAPLLGAAGASIALVWRHAPLRWLALASFLYSGAQLCLTGFLVTYLVAEVGLGLIVAGTLLSLTHAAGAVGRLVWGWLADRLGSGGIALILNGTVAILGALATAGLSSGWPVWAIAIAVAAFGFGAMGWNGVYIAVIARQAPPGGIGLATGGSLAVTYAGSIFLPPGFAALHDQLGLSYAAAYAALTLVTAVGIACIVQARRWHLKLVSETN